MSNIDPPTIEEVRLAAERLRSVARHTQLVPLHSFDKSSNIWLKPEIHQAVNSFKIRGVFHAVAALGESERREGISTVSAGNTAQALAWAGRHFGVAARSIMPDTAPAAKVDAVRAYGGTPELVPMEQVFRYLRERLWEQERFAFIHPWINRNVMIGHGTLAIEILEDCPDVEAVYIPVGGGGLIGGVGTTLKLLKPEVRVVAVQPVTCSAFAQAIQHGKPVQVQCQTCCDGVAVPYITDEVFQLVRPILDDVALVSEHDVKATVKRLALGNKIVAEPSGALSTAAALSRQALHAGPVVCLVTGGSIDSAKLISMLSE